MTDPIAAPHRVPAGRPPSSATALQAEYRLLLRNVATVGRLVAIGGLAIISLLASVAVRAASPDDPLRAATMYASGNISVLLPVAVLVFGAGAIGDLVDDGSLVYLWLRPVATWVHVVAACLATLTVALPLVLAPTLVATAIIHASGGVLASTFLAGLVATITYSCLFVMVGIRFRRALPWGLVYILIWEGFIASAGKTATKLAIRSYVRSILANGTGVTLKLAQFSTVSSVLVCVGVSIASVAYATRRLANTDVP
jgi:ABC-2 type transport system permease protein